LVQLAEGGDLLLADEEHGPALDVEVPVGGLDLELVQEAVVLHRLLHGEERALQAVRGQEGAGLERGERLVVGGGQERGRERRGAAQAKTAERREHRTSCVSAPDSTPSGLGAWGPFVDESQ